MHFEDNFSSASTAEMIRGLDMLFDLLDDLKLAKHEWISLVSHDHIVLESFLTTAIKRGYFGSINSWDEGGKTSLITELVSGCIIDPMGGQQIHSIETAAKDLFANEKSASKRHKKISTIMAAAIEDALLKWQFNLDTLKPDRKLAVEHKLRTPIAWLAKGQYTVTSNTYHSPTYATHPDPFNLIPYGARPHYHNYNEMVSLTFSFPQAELAELKEAEGGSSNVATVVKPAKTKSKRKEEVKNVGWQHLGHIDQLEAMANDSGVMIVDEEEKTTLEGQGSETQAVQGDETVVVDNTITVRKTLATGRMGSLLTFVKKVVRIQCAACIRAAENHSCTTELAHHRQAKELMSVLPLFVPADSPALRDVALAHALVNGNVAVVKELMSGTYLDEIVDVDGEEDVKPLSKAAVKPRLGNPEQPVLPTLAHWRILQAIERKPVDQFVDRIVDGAPFKRGYVQSSEITRTKERDPDDRREWYRLYTITIDL
jgi:hypothetical protein